MPQRERVFPDVMLLHQCAVFRQHHRAIPPAPAGRARVVAADAVYVVAVFVVLFFQETSKPESKVFITASNGKTVRVKTYGSLKEAIAAKVDNEMPIAE